MCVRKILYSGKCMLTKLILLAAIACMQSITSAEAAICFLPSGECDHEISVKTEGCTDWSAAEREQVCSGKNGYVRESLVATKESGGFSCSPVTTLGDICCPGWYYCTETNCQDQGYKLKEQLNPNYYICTPCTQGGDTYYKCEPKPCNYDPDNPTASTLDDTCTNTNGKYCIDTISTNLCTSVTVNGVEKAYTWTAVPSRKAGKRTCGRCVETTNPPSPPRCTGSDCKKCKNDLYYWKENLPGGCVTCTIAGNVNGKNYYCCEDITEYPVANCTEDTDGSCYSCEGPVHATGSEDINCYKQVDKKCGNDNQYVDRSVSGCYCRDYVYSLSATPTNLNYTAAGGVDTVAVTSTISTRSSTSNYRYDVETGKKGLCNISDNGSGTVTVNCGINTSTSQSSTSFNITQTPKKVTTTHKVLSQRITIRVEGDTCYQYQFSQSCPLAGWVAEYRRKSESGAANCYECVNDNCPSGYTKGNTPSPTEGYDTTSTDHGSNCYKAKTCKDGATTTNLNANGKCYDCTAHGYAGPTQCWICSHMDTTCDTANGYVWSESSCGCIAAGCTTGDVSKQSVEDCGSSGSAGWIYSYAGMSGGKKCGICTKKDCSGITTNLSASNSYYSCTSCYDGDVQRFTCTCNLTDVMCGAGKKADTSTCTCKTCSDSCAGHSWTANTNDCEFGYNTKSSICNIQCYECKAEELCPTGYSKAYQSQSDCKQCETFSSNGTANGKVCGKCTPPSTSCNTGQTWDNSQCKCVDSACPSGYSTAYQSESNCPTCNTYSFQGYSGSLKCGKCTPPSSTSCGSGQSWSNTECKCVDSACPSGYSTQYQSKSDCPPCNSFDTNGTSGNKVCGKCTAPNTSCSSGQAWDNSQCKCVNSACPSGYSTDYQSQSNCPACYSFDSNGTSGSKVCGRCTAPNTSCGSGQSWDSSQCKCVNSSCPSGYSTQYQSQSDCPACNSFTSNGSSGSKVCGKCTAPNTSCSSGQEWSTSQCKCIDSSCPSGYSTSYQSVGDCPSCNTFTSNGSSGSKVCGKCTAPNTSCSSGQEWNTSQCKCVDKTCPSGYSTSYQSKSDCLACYSFDSNGQSGNKVCGRCTAPNTSCGTGQTWDTSQCKCVDSTCPSGYSTQYQSVSNCPACYTFSSSGQSGSKVCGKCTAPNTSCSSGQEWSTSQCKCVNSSCPSGYSTSYQSVNDCPSCNTYSYNGSSGSLKCGKCTAPNTSCSTGQEWSTSQCKCVDKACPSGYSTQYQSVSNCSACYTFDSNGQSGSKVCGKCTAPNTSCGTGQEWSTSQCKCVDKACPSGYDTAHSSSSSCTACQTHSTNGYSGSKVCGKCTDPNSTCGTGQEYNWTSCKCVDKTCPSGYSTLYSSANSCSACYSFETNGYSGSKVCGKCTAPSTSCGTGQEYSWSLCKCVDKTCPSGYSTLYQSSSDCSSCYTYSYDGYSGSKKCGKCTAPSTSCGTGQEYSWTSCKCVDKTCPSGYSTLYQSASDCSSCYTYSYDGYSGSKKCGKCTAPSTSCSSGYTYSWSECGCVCVPTTCSTTTYPYTTTNLYSSTANTDSCNPGCGGTIRYNCKTNYKIKNGKCLYDVCPVSGEKKSTSELSCTHGTTTGTPTEYGTTCYKCLNCSDTCPVYGEKKNTSELSCSHGTTTGTPTACGTPCYKCACVQSTCSSTTYPYTSSDLYSSTANTDSCDPGCGGTVRYNCKTNYKKKNGKCLYDVCPVSGEKKSTSELSCNYGTTTGTSTEYGTTCYKCATCTQTTCSTTTYPYTTTNLYSSTANTNSCDPGCGGTIRYNCKTNYKIKDGKCKYDVCPVSGEKKSTSELSCTYGTTTGTPTEYGTTCYKCLNCSDTCPVAGEKKNTSELSCSHGTATGTPTGCGTPCYKCACVQSTCSTTTYPYTTTNLYSSTANTNSCDPGCGGTMRYNCKTNYKIKDGKCKYDVCPVSGEKKSASELTCTYGTTTGTPTEYGTTCYKCKSCTPNNSCTNYTITTGSPYNGKCSSCSNGCGTTKYKCDQGSYYYISGHGGYCYDSAHPCAMMNYANCSASPGSTYVDKASDCPSGTQAIATNPPMFNTSMFSSMPFKNLVCYACEPISCPNGTSSNGSCCPTSPTPMYGTKSTCESANSGCTCSQVTNAGDWTGCWVKATCGGGGTTTSGSFACNYRGSSSSIPESEKYQCISSVSGNVKTIKINGAEYGNTSFYTSYSFVGSLSQKTCSFMNGTTVLKTSTFKAVDTASHVWVCAYTN